jgi:diguanylate cyclase (GGDEF)-like protein
MSEHGAGDFTDEQTPLNFMSEKPATHKRPCLLVLAGPRLGEIFPVEGEVIIGREPDVTVHLPDDPGVSRRHARVTASDDGVLITDLGSANGVFVNGQQVSEHVLEEGAKIRIGQTTVLRYARYDALEEAAQRQLFDSALRDGLTRAFNRRYFDARLAAEVRFAERHRQGLALLLLEVDRFGELADRVGPVVCDMVLRRVVELLASALRAEDVLARHNAERLVVLLRNVGEGSAVMLGERLCGRIAEADFGRGGAPLSVTLSVGVAIFPFEGAPGDAASEQVAEELTTRAEVALDRARSAGHDRAGS